jgi:drug/metabolite transporter (DMT)-like permease
LKAKHSIAILWAILAAALYAISSPVSKVLLNKVPPTMMAALLYLGAGIGMSVMALFRYKTGTLKKEMRL